MSAIMIDIEGLATGPDAMILTIAAQVFDPFADTIPEEHFYARIDTESQEGRDINNETLQWWGTQKEAGKEALHPDNRIPLKDALEKLSKIVWNKSHVWANGPTYDMSILEHAYKSYGMTLPWQFFKVRDCRTVYSLCGNLNSPKAPHHALEDCKRQIIMLQDAIKQLKVTKIK